jgi:hypothetical protein
VLSAAAAKPDPSQLGEATEQALAAVEEQQAGASARTAVPGRAWAEAAMAVLGRVAPGPAVVEAAGLEGVAEAGPGEEAAVAPGGEAADETC